MGGNKHGAKTCRRNNLARRNNEDSRESIHEPLSLRVMCSRKIIKGLMKLRLINDINLHHFPSLVVGVCYRIRISTDEDQPYVIYKSNIRSEATSTAHYCPSDIKPIFFGKPANTRINTYLSSVSRNWPGSPACSSMLCFDKELKV